MYKIKSTQLETVCSLSQFLCLLKCLSYIHYYISMGIQLFSERNTKNTSAKYLCCRD